MQRCREHTPRPCAPRIILRATLVVFVTASSWRVAVEGAESPAADQALPPLHLQPLIEEALANNPDIKAMERRSRAAWRVPSQAGSLPDPKVGLTVMNMPLGGISLGRTPMSGVQIGAMQMVPYPGKLRLRREAATWAAESTVDDVVEKKNAIIEAVKQAYDDLFFVEQAIAVTQENKQLLESFVKIAETRYAVGRGIQQHVLRAQVELSKIIDDLIKLKQQRTTVRARLNTLLNRPPQAPLGMPVDVKPRRSPVSLEALYDGALESRPQLAATRDIVRQVEKSLELAQRDLKPDFEFGLGYRFRDNVRGDPVAGEDFLTASVGLVLPLWAKTKQKMRIEEVRETLEMWRQRYDSQKNDIYFAIRDQLAQIEKLDRQAALFRTGIIPQAEIALGSAQAAYQTGEVDFLTLLDAQQVLYKFQIQYYRVYADFAKAIAALERIIGQQLS